MTETFASNFDLQWGGWSGDYFDPLTFLDMWVKDGGNNGTKWHSEEIRVPARQGRRERRQRTSAIAF